MFFELTGVHTSVGGDPTAGEACALARAGGLNARTDIDGTFANLAVAEFGDRESGRLNVDVDAVEERAADAIAVTLDLRRSAAAFVFRIAELTARAGVHCRNEHEAAR